jgi:hypothetical protein
VHFLEKKSDEKFVEMPMQDVNQIIYIRCGNVCGLSKIPYPIACLGKGIIRLKLMN